MPSSASLGLVVWLLLSAACRADSTSPAVIEFWGMGREGEVVQQMVPEFERRTPGVQVRVQQIPWSAAHEKLLTAFVGDAMPDVFQAGSTWIPEFVALDALVPVQQRLASSAVTAAVDYFAGILDANVIDGVAYGVPWYVDTRVLFYRTDLLALAGVTQPPTTWEAWTDAMVRVKQRSGPGTYAILLPTNEWQTPVILAMQLNAGLLRDHDQYGDFRSAAFRRAFGFYLDLFRRDLAPRAGDAQVANVFQDFANGFFTFYITGPWNIGEFNRRLPPALAEHWATAPLPSADATYPGVSVAGGASLAISRRSAQPEAAWRWIEYLSEPAQQLELYRLTGDLPARQSVWTDTALAHNRRTQAFAAQLERVRATPKIPEWERIAALLTDYADAAVRERMTPDEALGALDTDVDAVLAKRRWMLQRRAAGREEHDP